MDGPRLLKKPILPSPEEKEAYIAKAKSFAKDVAAEVQDSNGKITDHTHAHISACTEREGF